VFLIRVFASQTVGNNGSDAIVRRTKLKPWRKLAYRHGAKRRARFGKGLFESAILADKTVSIRVEFSTFALCSCAPVLLCPLVPFRGFSLRFLRPLRGKRGTKIFYFFSNTLLTIYLFVVELMFLMVKHRLFSAAWPLVSIRESSIKHPESRLLFYKLTVKPNSSESAYFTLNPTWFGAALSLR
jgi:hypothetical protein